MAFGAAPVDVVRGVVGDAILPVAAGLGLGLGGVYYATPMIGSFLYDTRPHDPTTMAAVVAVLSIGAGVAAWLPARRAARVDPVVALRTV
jgi:ABC-type antimicrobial peptide transport system permease subunit